MTARHIAFAAALAVVAALLLMVPRGTGQGETLRTSERWLDGSAFVPAIGGDGVVSEVIEAPHAFTSLGAAWKASPASEWSHRVSADGRAWGDWVALSEDTHGRGNPTARVGELQFYDEPVRFVQFRADGDSLEVDGAHAVFIQPAPPAVPAPAPFVAASADNPVPKPPVVSRTGWGCPDGQGSRWSPVATDPDFLIVHHSAGSNSSNDWAATVQAIWSFHAITRGWGDVGYNFLIDPNGVIYEGRAGGDSVGAHFSCTNGGTMGVCMIGDFTGQEPTDSALESLAWLLAWKTDVESIDPLGQGYHSQSALTLNRISGHRDGNPGTQGCASGTVCPGAMLYPLLPDVRARTAEIVAAGTPFPPEVGLASFALGGEVSPGWSVDLNATLEHLDGGPVTGIVGTLTTASPYLTITDAEKNFPDLAEGASVADIGDFDFSIDTAAPHGHVAVLQLAVVSNEGEWTFPIVLPAIEVPLVLELAGVSATLGAVEPGAGVTLSYQIVANRGFGAGFELALIDPLGAELPLSPFTTNLIAGAQTKNRGVLIPAETPGGGYGLRVRISEGDAVVVDETFLDVVNVLAPDFDSWAAATITDPADRLPTSDPEGDGIANLLEYALVLDPLASDPSPLQFVWVDEAGQRYPAVVFTQRAGLPGGVLIEVDTGDDAWATATVEVSSSAVPGAEQRLVRSTQPASAMPRQLLRARFEEE